jgi:hypothetical protein
MIIRRPEITTGRKITMRREITTDREITISPEITMGREITMRREITTGLEITMAREIVMGRNQLTAATMRHGMDAPQTGRYRAASVSPTKALSVEDHIPGTVVRRDTRYRAASVSPILDHVSQKTVSSSTASFFRYL